MAAKRILLRRFNILLPTGLLLVFLPGQSQGQTTVTNNNDSGSGSLRYAVTNYPAQTISWQAGSGGTLSLASSLPTVQANTLDVSNAGSAVTIQDYSIPLSGAVTFVNNSANAWTISSVVSDSSAYGSLYKSGSGALVLSGANTYSGGTFVQGGILNINSDAALGNTSSGITFSGGTLQAAAGLYSARNILLSGDGTFDTNGYNSTLAGIIGGGGQFTVTGSGVLNLSGTNSYSGGTLVTGGATLGVNGSSALGTGGVTLAGGTLQTQAALSDSRNITLGLGGGTIDTDGFNSTFSGSVTGSALTKVGSGILNLSNAGNNLGATTVSAGTLQFGVDNALSGGGGVTVSPGAVLDLNGFSQTNSLGAVVNNGLFNVGAGRATMNNGYSGAGTLALQIRTDGAANLTSSGNNINPSSTRLSVGLQKGLLPTNGEQFTVITGLTAASSFASIVSPAALAFLPTYAGGDLILTTEFVPFASIAATPNEAAVGRALEPLRSNPTGDAATVMGSLYSLDAAGLQSAMDQISPISLATIAGLAKTGAEVHAAAVSRRIAVLADGPTRGNVDSLGAGDQWSDWGAENWHVSASSEEGNSPWSFFGSVVGNRGIFKGVSGGSGYQPGYDFDVAGIHLGGDGRINDVFAAGLTGAYLRSHASLSSTGGGTVDDNSGHLGAYVVASADDWRADAYVGGAIDSYSSNRGISFADISRSARASPSGGELNLSMDGSFDLRSNAMGTFSPFAGLNYDRVNIGGFTEAGADSLNLSVAPETTSSMRSNLGLRFSQKARLGSGAYAIFFDAGWRHEFVNQSYSIGGQLAAGGGSFSVNTADVSRDGAIFGGGVSTTLGQQLTVDISYSGDLRSYYVANTVNAGLHYKF